MTQTKHLITNITTMVVETIFIWNFFFEKKKIKVLKNLACHNIFWKVLKKNNNHTHCLAVFPQHHFLFQYSIKSIIKVQKKYKKKFFSLTFKRHTSLPQNISQQYMCNCTKLRVIVCTKNYTLRDLSNCNIPPPLNIFPPHPPTKNYSKKHSFMQEKKM